MPVGALILTIVGCTLLVIAVLLVYEKRRFDRIETQLKVLLLMARTPAPPGVPKDDNGTRGNVRHLHNIAGASIAVLGATVLKSARDHPGKVAAVGLLATAGGLTWAFLPMPPTGPDIGARPERTVSRAPTPTTTPSTPLRVTPTPGVPSPTVDVTREPDRPRILTARTTEPPRLPSLHPTSGPGPTGQPEPTATRRPATPPPGPTSLPRPPSPQPIPTPKPSPAPTLPPAPTPPPEPIPADCLLDLEVELPLLEVDLGLCTEGGPSGTHQGPLEGPEAQGPR